MKKLLSFLIATVLMLSATMSVSALTNEDLVYDVNVTAVAPNWDITVTPLSFEQVGTTVTTIYPVMTSKMDTPVFIESLTFTRDLTNTINLQTPAGTPTQPKASVNSKYVTYSPNPRRDGNNFGTVDVAYDVKSYTVSTGGIKNELDIIPVKGTLDLKPVNDNTYLFSTTTSADTNLVTGAVKKVGTISFVLNFA